MFLIVDIFNVMNTHKSSKSGLISRRFFCRMALPSTLLMAGGGHRVQAGGNPDGSNPFQRLRVILLRELTPVHAADCLAHYRSHWPDCRPLRVSDMGGEKRRMLEHWMRIDFGKGACKSINLILMSYTEIGFVLQETEDPV